MKLTFHYSPEHDIAVPGLSALHPFDGRKYSRAWKLLEGRGERFLDPGAAKSQPASDELLELVHTHDYLRSLDSSSVVAQALELAPVRFLPGGLVRKYILEPMRIATMSTCLATAAALESGGVAFNFGGGYHHAFADHGEGFCIYADAAIAIASSRRSGALDSDGTVLFVDLDAHRGNGIEEITRNDRSVRHFDMYNFQVYPGPAPGDPDETPFLIPMKSGTTTSMYLDTLKQELPAFLNAAPDARIAFYNAGTDILDGDPLGGMGVSAKGVLDRDRYVVEQLIERGIPVVILTSGGYTQESHRLIAGTASYLMER